MVLDEVRASEVKDAETFARFCQQTYGTPYPMVKGMITLKKHAKKVFEEHPDLDWQTMVKVAEWCATKRRRVAHVHQYIQQFRWAYADGAINLRPVAEIAVDQALMEALFDEEDPVWREKLMRADGTEAKRIVLDQWRKERGGVGD